MSEYGNLRIVVTGASGFVGGRLVSALRSAAPAAVVIAWGGTASPGCEMVDITDLEAVRAAMRAARPDVIIHLAAESSVGEAARNADLVWRTNFDGVRVVATAAKAFAEGTKRPIRFVFASSAEVYGTQFNHGPVDEMTAPAPTSVYGRTKAAAELYLRDVADDKLRVVALRLFNHTGPGQDDRFVVPALAKQIARIPAGEPGEIQVGNLDAVRDFSDVGDILEAYVCVALKSSDSASPFELYNVGSGAPRSIRSILDRLVRLHGAEISVHLASDRMRPSDIPSTIASFERFTQAYGWTSRRNFDDTIAAILAFERGRS